MRIKIEKAIDSFLESPSEYEDHFKSALTTLGINPDQDTILAFICGYILGRDEFSKNFDWGEYLDIMQRRTWELRQAFMITRIEK
jgi:hypothetical protein